MQGQIKGLLRQGLVLTVISNTSAAPIGGIFGNLSDGAIVTVSGNNFQANYEGGDGNDLTLSRALIVAGFGDSGPVACRSRTTDYANNADKTESFFRIRAIGVIRGQLFRSRGRCFGSRISKSEGSEIRETAKEFRQGLVFVGRALRLPRL